MGFVDEEDLLLHHSCRIQKATFQLPCHSFLPYLPLERIFTKFIAQ